MLDVVREKISFDISRSISDVIGEHKTISDKVTKCRLFHDRVMLFMPRVLGYSAGRNSIQSEGFRRKRNGIEL